MKLVTRKYFVIMRYREIPEDVTTSEKSRDVERNIASAGVYLQNRESLGEIWRVGIYETGTVIVDSSGIV